MKCKLCSPHKIAVALVIVGAINWGLVGLFGFNLVSYLFSSWSFLERLIYILVGLSGILMCFFCSCKKCAEGCCGVGGEKKM
ncbi:MAG: DUF378 domain-containing protein [Patescibacteria group bacterium]